MRDKKVIEKYIHDASKSVWVNNKVGIKRVIQTHLQAHKKGGMHE